MSQSESQWKLTSSCQPTDKFAGAMKLDLCVLKNHLAEMKVF